jgi:Na+/melibiose symporter-like transporter
MNAISEARTPDPAYQRLYKLGGAAAFVVAALTLGEVLGFTLYGQPATVSGWFELFQTNTIGGLLQFWGLEVPMYVMFALVYLALYVVLRKASPSGMAIVLILALLGVGIFLTTNNPFSMLSLSQGYAAATTEAQRSIFLAAGQALLAQTGQRAVGGFNAGLFLLSVAGLITSSVMLRGDPFSRLTAGVGLVAHALSLADYLRQALTPSPAIALLVILPSALFLVIWYILIGRRLYQLGRVERKTLPRQPQSETFERTSL